MSETKNTEIKEKAVESFYYYLRNGSAGGDALRKAIRQNCRVIPVINRSFDGSDHVCVVEFNGEEYAILL